MSARGKRSLWALNLDAESELAALRASTDPRQDGATRADARARARLARRLRRLGHAVLGDDNRPPVGLPGRAWMPTPRALAALDAAGAAPAGEPPPVDVLIAANARETARAMDIGEEGALPGSLTAGDLDGFLEAIARPGEARAPGSGRRPAWLVRPSLTGAGRARLVVDAGDTDPVRLERAVAFARRHLAAGPLDVAPLVDVEREFSIHGLLRPLRGPGVDLAVGRPLVQHASGGAWRGARCDPTATDPFAAELEAALRAAGATLARIGYRGPFGIDALLWRDGRGERRLHAPLEINARYTMAWWRSGLAGLDPVR